MAAGKSSLEKLNHLHLLHPSCSLTLLSEGIKERLIKKRTRRRISSGKKRREEFFSASSSHLQLFLIFARVKSTENFCNWRLGKWSVRLLPLVLPYSVSSPPHHPSLSCSLFHFIGVVCEYYFIICCKTPVTYL